MVLEYKYEFGALARDFNAEEKSPSDIDLVVCWDVKRNDMDDFVLKSMLISDEGANRRFFAATHKAFTESDTSPKFEIIVLKHLLNYLLDPAKESATQAVLFG